MKPKRIVREPEACNRLGCRRTKFRTDYRFNNPADPNVQNTKIPRLRPVPLGPRNIGFLDDELDELITALAELRDTAPAAKRTTRVFITDRKPKDFNK
jgi:predicted DNA-binding transcriptional regulator AlpA